MILHAHGQAFKLQCGTLLACFRHACHIVERSDVYVVFRSAVRHDILEFPARVRASHSRQIAQFDPFD